MSRNVNARNARNVNATNSPADATNSPAGPLPIYAPEPLASYYPEAVGTWTPGDNRVVVAGERVSPSTLATDLALGAAGRGFVLDAGGGWSANGWTGDRAIRVAAPGGGLAALDVAYPGRAIRPRNRHRTSVVVAPAETFAAKCGRLLGEAALAAANAATAVVNNPRSSEAMRAKCNATLDKLRAKCDAADAAAREAAAREAAATAEAEAEAALAALGDLLAE